MPVSKHRRRGKPGTVKPDQPSNVSRQDITTIDDLRQIIANPAHDFSAKAAVAGVWWFQQLLRKAGDHRQTAKPSWKDRRRAVLLLCVAMDGERGENDDLSPEIAAMLRPWCPAPTFAGAWEQANRLPQGTVAATAVRILRPAGKATV
jgi:hypothetical protein